MAGEFGNLRTLGKKQRAFLFWIGNQLCACGVRFSSCDLVGGSVRLSSWKQ
jgi:hypothetical protein